MDGSDEGGPPLATERHPFNIFRRAFGIRIINSLNFGASKKLRGKRRKELDKAEPTKAIIQSSWQTSALRSIVHLVPVLASMVLVALNFGHLYLGRSPPGLVHMPLSVFIAILQVIAKLMEISIVGSLGTIVTHFLRDYLVNGPGLPLGLIESSSKFSEVSYFWSPDFWSIKVARIQWRTKISIVLLLLACGIIAVFAGPATAVLLIPRQQDWWVGSLGFYLPGDDADLFPTTVTSRIYDGSLCLDSRYFGSAACPTGGFESLSAFAATAISGTARDTLPATRSVETLSNVDTIPNSAITSILRGSSCDTSAIAAYAPVTIYQTLLWDDINTVVQRLQWNALNPWTMSGAEYKFRFSQSLTAETTSPVVRSTCSPAQNISKGATSMKFPVLEPWSCPSHPIEAHGLSLNDTPSDFLRTTWTDLSSDFGTTSIGLIFEAPWVNGSSRVAIGCSFDARWAKSSQEDTTATPSDLDTSGSDKRWAPFAPPKDSPSWIPIRLDFTWLDLIDAVVPPEQSKYQNRTVTVLESLLNDAGIVDSQLRSSQNQTKKWDTTDNTFVIELAATLLVTDGLSRYGTTLVLNMSSEDSRQWSPWDYTKAPDFASDFLNGNGKALVKPTGLNATAQTLTFVINGYCYQASEVTDFLSAAVLLAYMALASWFTIYTVFFRRQTSHTWDSITEIIALAHNSRPSSTALRNASSGIDRFGTFAQTAVIRARRTGEFNDDGQQERYQAELVFINDEPRPGRESTESIDGSDHAIKGARSAMTFPLDLRSQSRLGSQYSAATQSAGEGFTSRDLLLHPRHGMHQLRDVSRHRELDVDTLEVIQTDRLYG